MSAKARKYYHHLGAHSYNEAREKWMFAHYPHKSTMGSTMAMGTNSTTKVTQARQPVRVLDLWCSMHGVDAKGKRVLLDPSTEQITNIIVSTQKMFFCLYFN